MPMTGPTIVVRGVSDGEVYGHSERLTIGWKWGFICPCERKSGNQSVDRTHWPR